jgi:hypothetical protein
MEKNNSLFRVQFDNAYYYVYAKSKDLVKDTLRNEEINYTDVEPANSKIKNKIKFFRLEELVEFVKSQIKEYEKRLKQKKREKKK